MKDDKNKCSSCHHDCHCEGDLHADEYGVCTCEDCNCRYHLMHDKGDTPHSEWIAGYNEWKKNNNKAQEIVQISTRVINILSDDSGGNRRAFNAVYHGFRMVYNLHGFRAKD